MSFAATQGVRRRQSNRARSAALAIALFAVLLAFVDLPVAEGQPTPSPPSAMLMAPSSISWSWGSDPADFPQDKVDRITQAMDEAVVIYNRYSDMSKDVRVVYNPAVPTADANINGWIRFGGSINTRVALHEIAHTLGVGTHSRWGQFREDGNVWTGEWVNTYGELFEATPISAGRQHFWPYGLNYNNEASPFNFFAHVKMVEAFQCDLGLFDNCAVFDVDAAFNMEPDPEVAGDADCDGVLTIVDALVIAQYTVSSRADVGSCPLGNPATDINAHLADIDSSGVADVLDALLVAQCSVGIEQAFCPADAAG